MVYSYIIIQTEKLVVWVTVNDLRAISAYDNASVESFGKLSSLDLNLSLNNNATANFNLDCAEAKIAVNDNAKANISGTATQSSIVVNQSATLNTAKFYAEQVTQKRVTPGSSKKKTYLTNWLLTNTSIHHLYSKSRLGIS